MRLRILGCSGGVGQGLRTTSLLIDDDILIDAGSGVGDLSLDEMAMIRHVFITHSHLDHVSFLPLLLDSVFERLAQPLLVHAQPATLKALQDHIFNWVIWPDFAQLPDPSHPVMEYQAMLPGEIITLGQRRLEMIAVNHTVPGVGYCVDGGDQVFAFSGDTTVNENLWLALNGRPRLDLLIVEAAFDNANMALSNLARHYCPALLAADLTKLRHDPLICITHNKPGEEQSIFAECQAAIVGRRLQQLHGGEVFDL